MSLDQRSASQREVRQKINPTGPQRRAKEHVPIVPVQPAWTEDALVPAIGQATRLTDDGRRALCAFARRMRELAPN